MRSLRLILWSVAIWLLGASAAFAETIVTQDYWILKDGYSAKYYCAMFNCYEQITMSYGSYGPYGKYSLENVFEVNWPGSTGTADREQLFNQFFKYAGGKLLYCGAKYVDINGESVYVPDGPQAFLPAAVELGKTYECSWNRMVFEDGFQIGGGTDKYTITVTGPFSTTVPAGTYTTYKFELTNLYQNWILIIKPNTTEYTYYLAEGIGWVKLIRDGVTYELTSLDMPPSPPRLSAATSGVTLSLSWTSTAGASGYTLFYAPYPSASYIGSIDMGTRTGGSFLLWDGAAFYVAVKAHNGYGSSGYSNIEHFAIDISAAPPMVTTGPATSVTSSSAALTGTVNPNGAETTYYFQYGTTTGYGSTTTGIAAGSGTTSVSASTSLTGLSSGTTYHYRLAAANGGGTAYGADDWFTTTVSSSTYTNSLGQTFVLIPAGTFIMGSPSNEPFRAADEGPQHQVALTQPFYMQTTEVTQDQWDAVMGSNPSYFSGCPTCPVEGVSWNDVQMFVTEMNKRGEGVYSLPSEAQWEYAARAGSTTAFYNGGITEADAEYDPNLNPIGWYAYNSGARTHPVAQKAPNAWDLYDMSGNVYEWCLDWYGSNYYGSSPATDPAGPVSGAYRVLRGGSWYSGAKYCRSAYRGAAPNDRYLNVGFRLLRQP